MPPSQKRLAANRANAKKGGARTPEHKAAVRHNALKHGLWANSAVAIKAGPLAETEEEIKEFSPGSSMAWLLVTLLRRTWRSRSRGSPCSWPGRCVATRCCAPAPLTPARRSTGSPKSRNSNRPPASCSTLLTGSKPAGPTRAAAAIAQVLERDLAILELTRADVAVTPDFAVIARVLDRCHDEVTIGVSKPRTAAAWEHVAVRMFDRAFADAGDALDWALDRIAESARAVRLLNNEWARLTTTQEIELGAPLDRRVAVLRHQYDRKVVLYYKVRTTPQFIREPLSNDGQK